MFGPDHAEGYREERGQKDTSSPAARRHSVGGGSRSIVAFVSVVQAEEERAAQSRGVAHAREHGSASLHD